MHQMRMQVVAGMLLPLALLLLSPARLTEAQLPVHQPPLVRVRYGGSDPPDSQVYPSVLAARNAIRERLRCVRNTHVHKTPSVK